MPSISKLQQQANIICERLGLDHPIVQGSNNLRRKGYIGLFRTPNLIYLARKDMKTLYHELGHYLDWNQRRQAGAHDKQFVNCVRRVVMIHNH